MKIQQKNTDVLRKLLKMTPILNQLIILTGTLVASFSAGAGMGFPTILLYQLKKENSEIPLDLDSSSWIGSIHGLVGIPGIIAPLVMQWRGRKFTFIAGCFVILMGWTIAYMATGLGMLLASESLHGFGANVLITVSYDCLSEMITPAYRNVAVQSYFIVHGLGLTMAGIFTKLFYWRTFCLASSIPALVAIIISKFWLESPLWLAYKDEIDKFKTNFIKLRGTDDLSIKELQELMVAQNEKRSKKKAFKSDTFSRKILRQITSRDFWIPALHVFLLLNHSYWSGGIVVAIYSIELITKGTQNEYAAFIGGIVMNFIFVFGAVVSNILIKFFNNKPVVMWSAFGTTVSLLGVSLVSYLQSLGVVSEKSLFMLYFLVSYVMCFSLGQGTVTMTMSSELMPVKHRGLGGALFVIYMCLLHASALKISPYLFASIGLYGTFLIYASNSAVCGILIWKYVPETKGKTLQEIENFYMNGTFEINISPDEIQHIDTNDL